MEVLDNAVTQYPAGGFCLLLKRNGVYNVTETVNGAFDKDALICGDQSDNALSVIGQGSNRFVNCLLSFILVTKPHQTR